jgi:NAD(P)-dependent dehydrogenase (short-subunit alcohol dehydrogenase family)
MNQSSIAAGEDFSRFIDATPSKRFGQPEEIAWTCLFLSHPNSGFIVGQSIVVDGGYTLT